ncbi:Os06g0200300 [Oryza sativa Japonica Group]|uniref:Os06g0200300 protein n=1 Tax=Oryza sativa subsp. japonica TaxID=39947 RepID=Q0DDT9_ORYSJ|nr:Os06g0200300 [Oryza sativa Japonica Group]|eukprot:NP_001057070.2 Os06g0200300 [Oryza sativa Japonica Group]
MTRRRPRDGDDGDDPATAATAPPTRSGHRSPCAARCGKVGDGGGGKVRDDVMGGAGDGATGADGAPDQTCPPPPVRCSLREVASITASASITAAIQNYNAPGLSSTMASYLGEGTALQRMQMHQTKNAYESTEQHIYA